MGIDYIAVLADSNYDTKNLVLNSNNNKYFVTWTGFASFKKLSVIVSPNWSHSGCFQ